MEFEAPTVTGTVKKKKKKNREKKIQKVIVVDINFSPEIVVWDKNICIESHNSKHEPVINIAVIGEESMQKIS